jgi:hypothetical protein
MATNQHSWTQLSDKDLLKMRLCDLNLRLKGHPLQSLIAKLHQELRSKEILLTPHIYISDDWFCPDGTTSFTIPFFLLHPRLLKLERRFIGEVEGETEEHFMKLIRHEMGHVIDNAFKLRKVVRRRNLFGASHAEYPASYEYRPYSKNYVRHIEEGYAQSHPDEDWAETFAVWLTPKSNWRKSYKNWPALKKLDLLNTIMEEKVLKTPPIFKNKKEEDSLSSLTMTLGEYFMEKRERLQLDRSKLLAPALETFFTVKNQSNKFPLASQYLKKNKVYFSQEIGIKTEVFRYKVDRVLDSIIEGCESSQRRLATNLEERPEKLIKLLAGQVKDFIRKGHHKVIM